MTVDLSNTTALHTAATQGHIDVVNYLLDVYGSLALIARSNGKTALHSAARNGHLEVVRALLRKDPGIVTRTDKKGQTALHMAAKGTSLELVQVLLNCDPALVNSVDTKGNSALHIAARKGRCQVKSLKLFPVLLVFNLIFVVVSAFMFGTCWTVLSSRCLPRITRTL